MKKKLCKTREEARDHAIQWQHWMGTQNLSWGEIAEWQDYFTLLGNQFNLIEEFKDNGIL